MSRRDQGQDNYLREGELGAMKERNGLFQAQIFGSKGTIISFG